MIRATARPNLPDPRASHSSPLQPITMMLFMTGEATPREDGPMESRQALPSQAEIVVIGAGLLGCSIAYQLAKRGKQVVVLDKRGICSGASGRNGGLTSAGSSLYTTAARAVTALTTENLRM